ncbi:unnamed protein product, partial [Darwinula stevensoni]
MTFLGTIGGLVAGFTVGFTSVALPSLEKDENAPFTLTSQSKAWFVSMVSLAQLLGGLVAALIAKHWSRKWLLIALLIPIFASWLMIAYPLNLSMFMIGRGLTGFFFGIRTPISQLYIAEIAHKDRRGLLASCTVIALTFATMLTYILGTFMEWRALALTLGIIPVALIPLVLFVPESPTFLLLHKRHEEAATALRKLRGPHYDITMEMDQVIKHIKESQETRSHFRDIFQWNYLKPVGLLMDHVGRKRLTIISSFLMTFAHFGFGLYYYFLDNELYMETLKSLYWVPIVTLCLFVAGFSLGMSAVVFVL